MVLTLLSLTWFLWLTCSSNVFDDTCNPDYDYYSDCACQFATIAVNSTSLQKCFNNYVCYYNASSRQFCSGHGTCHFNESRCDCNNNYGKDDCSKEYSDYVVNKAMSTTMIIFGCLSLVLCLGLIIWVYIYRNVSDVKAMSIVFTQLFLVGCCLLCIAAIIIGGATLVIGCSLLKAYRISSIFSSSLSSKTGELTDKRLLKYLCVLLCISLFFLTLYTIFNFLEGGAYYRKIEDKLQREYRCSSEPLTMVSYSLLVAFELFLLLMVLKYGNNSKMATRLFKETKCIYIGSNYGTVVFIAFGIFILFTTNYSLQIAIRGFGTILCVIFWTGLLFYPKLLSVYKPEKQINDMNNKQKQLTKKYTVNLRDKSGKELLLILNLLLQEMTQRTKMKMLSLELNDNELNTISQLLDKIKQLSINKSKKQSNDFIVQSE